MGAGWVFFKFQSKVMQIRALPEQELAGMDISENGVDVYADFQQHGERLA